MAEMKQFVEIARIHMTDTSVNIRSMQELMKAINYLVCLQLICEVDCMYEVESQNSANSMFATLFTGSFQTASQPK